MRKTLAVLGAVLTMGVPGASLAQEQPGWSYAYTNGVATATQRNDDGDVVATITCAPPRGDMVLTDYTFDRNVRNAREATVAIGWMSITVPAEVKRERRKHIVSVRLPQRPPVLAAMQPNTPLTVTVNGRTRDLTADGAQQMKDVAFACWGS